MRKLLALALILLTACACDPVVEDSSAFAMEAGNKNVFLGSNACGVGVSQGYIACQVETGSNVPDLRIIFMNAGEYAVGDCLLGVYKSGSVNGPQEVKIDMSGLKDQLNTLRLCPIKVEGKEYYPDPRDENQTRQYPIGGVFFLEMIDKGYLSHPPKRLLSWCAKIGRTNKGRDFLKVLDAEDCE